MTEIRVNASKSYDILVGNGFCNDFGALIKKTAGGTSAALVSDDRVWSLYGEMVEMSLKSAGTIRTDFGEDLSWDYLSYVRSHPIEWHVPTHILYGSNDNLTSFKTIADFSNKHQATLTVMENGEHWFHTDEQMAFLDNWIKG